MVKISHHIAPYRRDQLEKNLEAYPYGQKE